MGKVTSLLGGLGVGALAMYFMDPERGRSRRALVEDKLQSAWKAKLEAKQTMVRDLRNRLQGLTAETKARFSKPKMKPDDEKLVARVRSEMGHVISHPGAIEVMASGTTVLLQGSILASEMEPLMACIWKVPGVDAIEHQLHVHQSADGVPSLQGEGHLIDRTPELLREQWKPATSLAVGMVGGLLATYGMIRKGVVGTVLATAGAAVLTKSLNDTEGKRIAERTLDSGWR